MITPPASADQQQGQEGSKVIGRLWLILIIVLAAILRLYVNFSPELMPGVNTPYYPVQVRSILETGHLGFPDLPFVFYLEAFFAKLLHLFNLCDLSGCIMASWKIIDAVLYPLIAIPVFLLAGSVARNVKAPKWVLLLPSILVVASFPAWIMMGELQKNSIGLVWAMFYIYFLYRGVYGGKVIDYILAGVFFILTGLTHLGALGFCLAFSASFLFFSIIIKHERRIYLIKISVLLLLAAASISAFLLYFDPGRFGRLASVMALPTKIFEQPIIFGFFKDQASTMLMYFQNPMGINANAVAILGLVLFFRKRKEISPQEKILLLASISVTIFMGSPFLGAEWAQRLYLMAYIPTIIVFIFLLKYIAAAWKKLLLTALVLIVTSAPTPMLLISGMKSTPSINKEAYNHLLKLKKMIDNPEETLIITRHGLEWWLAWVLEVDVGQMPSLTKESFQNYDNVYLLRQKSGQQNVGPPGPGGSFPEVVIPPGAEITYEDEYFILARAPEETPRFHYEEK
ncbi:MAG: hypothetical protein A2Z24_01315 [Candidatus Woykebacteria bacterium RBG_16_44_10]|uniref:Glycosyltransferase RgtA/B/C/D-like domain-containing protein n=1 Tax=Candidatus Woykebacteria bacterium RBG_16_44_10 TaxID=1802597 RepID=A0A1G1WDL0_9BACT|nr:MAG: hypothetical protein A2Z24_01315 [Candidatus Woykebacteria bacterium RBG_16_44_10]